MERAGIVFGWSKIKWARILGLNWSGQGWNILFVLDSNRRRVWVTSLEYLDGAEVKWTRKKGIEQRGRNFWTELDGDGVKWADIWMQLVWNI